jgi:hypothetical protein
VDGSVIAAIKQKISANEINQAISECRELGRAEFRKRYGLGRAKRYFLKIGIERFDSKAIVCVAAKYVRGSPGPFTRKDIHGGPETVRVLETLGFTVVIENIGTLAITDDDADPETIILSEFGKQSRICLLYHRAKILNPFWRSVH